MTPHKAAQLLKARAFDLSMQSDQADHVDTIKEYEEAAKAVEELVKATKARLERKKMVIQYDKSLYTKINKETQAAVDKVNADARLHGMGELADWGMQTTLRAKQNFLNAWLKEKDSK